MAESEDSAFKAEYAKSGRASCKGCKENIGQGSLRMAIMVQSPFFDGKQPNWHHFACFWKKTKCNDTDDIHGFNALRWDDQEKIKEKIKSGGGGGAEGGSKKKGAVDNTLTDFKCEYAKSGASKCRGCEEKIVKDEVRISKKDYESQKAKMYGPVDLWHHIDCFVEHRADIGFLNEYCPEFIVGFKTLRKEDKAEVLEKLGEGDKASLKRKADSSENGQSKKAKTSETKEEKQLKEQSKAFWKIRDQIEASCAMTAMKLLLEYNNQEVPVVSKVLDRVADCMMFGALKKCPECKKGDLHYSANAYVCSGNISGWTKCQYITQEPERMKFKIPEEFHDVEFLKKYKYVKKSRIFPPNSLPKGNISSSSSEDKPLEGMTFFIISKKLPKEEIQKKILQHGGTLADSLTKDVTACVCTKDEADNGKNKSLKTAEKMDIHVIDESYFDALKSGGAVLLITQHSLCPWGSDPHSRIKSTPSGPMKSAYKKRMEAKKEDMFTKDVPATLKMKLKGGAAVDPDSGLESTSHVYEEKGVIFNAILGQVDISRGSNSYYKLQLLESDSKSRYHVFRAWGRVGTTVGGNKLEDFYNKDNAKAHFEYLYSDKTANSWSDRDNFEKKPNKFYPLDIDYGTEDENVQAFTIDSEVKSSLAKPVQDLIRLIFDVETMKQAMLEYEIDLKKMPLGKLSKKQIESAFKVLTELTVLQENGGTKTEFLDASNRFYTLIPHDFGLKTPPLLDANEIIKNKTDMLNNLLEIEIAYSMLKAGDSSDTDPLKSYYDKLKTDIGVVDKKSEEYSNIEKYLTNTHAKTHNFYKLEIEEIYSLERHGEKKRYKPFKALDNRQLLWHGSGLTNFVGILSQGLRIAPPEAPTTGYMFGKGVYFADMVSKSANYCRTSHSNPTGMLMLCEVALGNMYELKKSSYITKLASGFHSTKGCGRTNPDPSDFHTSEDGVKIPYGKGVEAEIGSSSLLYNEYIVYDVAQINMKYLLRCNFKYN